MPATEDQSAQWQARCIACGYTLNVPREAGRCSECGEPLRLSVDRYLVKQKIASRAQLGAGVGLVSVLFMPLLGPLVIFLGWRTLRDARVYNIKGMPRILAVGAIVKGLI